MLRPAPSIFRPVRPYSAGSAAPTSRLRWQAVRSAQSTPPCCGSRSSAKGYQTPSTRNFSIPRANTSSLTGKGTATTPRPSDRTATCEPCASKKDSSAGSPTETGASNSISTIRSAVTRAPLCGKSPASSGTRTGSGTRIFSPRAPSSRNGETTASTPASNTPTTICTTFPTRGWMSPRCMWTTATSSRKPICRWRNPTISSSGGTWTWPQTGSTIRLTPTW